MTAIEQIQSSANVCLLMVRTGLMMNIAEPIVVDYLQLTAMKVLSGCAVVPDIASVE
jgi:hypothetical protein